MARNVEDCGSGTRTCSEKTPGRDYSELSGDLAAVGPSLTRGERALSGRPPHPRTARFDESTDQLRTPPGWHRECRRPGWPSFVVRSVELIDRDRSRGGIVVCQNQIEFSNIGRYLRNVLRGHVDRSRALILQDLELARLQHFSLHLKPLSLSPGPSKQINQTFICHCLPPATTDREPVYRRLLGLSASCASLSQSSAKRNQNVLSMAFSAVAPELTRGTE